MLAVVLAVSLLSASQEVAGVPAVTNAETCVRDKATAAVNASSGAADAATFLLEYLCAVPVERAVTWQVNTDMLASMRQVVEGMRTDPALSEMATEDADDSEAEIAAVATPLESLFGDFDDMTVDPVTGELVTSTDVSSMAASTLRMQTSAYSQMAGNRSPAHLRELAAQMVLEARSRR